MNGFFTRSTIYNNQVDQKYIIKQIVVINYNLKEKLNTHFIKKFDKRFISFQIKNHSRKVCDIKKIEYKAAEVKKKSKSNKTKIIKRKFSLNMGQKFKKDNENVLNFVTTTNSKKARSHLSEKDIMDLTNEIFDANFEIVLYMIMDIADLCLIELIKYSEGDAILREVLTSGLLNQNVSPGVPKQLYLSVSIESLENREIISFDNIGFPNQTRDSEASGSDRLSFKNRDWMDDEELLAENFAELRSTVVADLITRQFFNASLERASSFTVRSLNVIHNNRNSVRVNISLLSRSFSAMDTTTFLQAGEGDCDSEMYVDNDDISLNENIIFILAIEYTNLIIAKTKISKNRRFSGTRLMDGKTSTKVIYFYGNYGFIDGVQSNIGYPKSLSKNISAETQMTRERESFTALSHMYNLTSLVTRHSIIRQQQASSSFLYSPSAPIHPSDDSPRVSDHRISDHRISDRRISGHRISDHRISDHRISDHRISDISFDRRISDHKISDHKISDDRVSDRIVSDCKLSDRKISDIGSTKSFDECLVNAFTRRLTQEGSQSDKSST